MKITREHLRRFAPVILVLTGLAVYFIWNSAAAGRVTETVTALPMMSTTAVFKYRANDPKEIDKAVRDGVRAMEKVSAICNIFDPASELSRLNAAAAETPFACSEDLWEILQTVRRFHRISGGAFDPTIRPLMTLWGFHRKRETVPQEQEIRAALAKCGFSRIVFDDEKHTVFFPVQGMSLDLGGIAKGWAVDRAAAAAAPYKLTSGIVDLGGNMLCFGRPEGDPFFRIGIQNPKKKQAFSAVAEFPAGAIATSGSYERYSVIDGVRYSHIMDPRTGRPVPGSRLSASIIVRDAVTADALSTTLFILGRDFLPELQRGFPECRAMVMDEDQPDAFLGSCWSRP